MRAVLGIDAAWTLTPPSGVALVAEHHRHWRLIAAEASYQRFQVRANTGLPTKARPQGSRPDPSALLASALMLCGCPVNLVAIDMPLAHTPITGRRTCDDAVSRVYEVYRRLAGHVGVESLFILSAGWELIPASFLLTPDYDITFKPPKGDEYKRRRMTGPYSDFQMLPPGTRGPVIFIGGKEYVPLFASLT